MIRTFRFWLLAILAISFAACGKEKSVDSTDGERSGVFSMKIDGKQWIADEVSAAITADGYLVISGQSASKISFSIKLKADKPGKYQLDPSTKDDFVGIMIDQSGATTIPYGTGFGNDPNNAGGIVEITEIDNTSKILSGKFQLKVLSADGSNKVLTLTEGLIENLSFASSNNPGGPGNPGTGSGTFAAKVNGTAFPVSIVSGTSGFGLLSITALSGGGNTLLLSMPAAITAGTYNLAGSLGYIAAYSEGITQYQTVVSGELIITEHNTATKTIKGTFNFKVKKNATDNFDITEGSFSVTYVEVQVP
ncbi:hypothetical protein HHL16_02640 [Pseudoflavitalea sp. G-6-1-2]|uniref:DUF6252 family protein n=1 Tax=Pseudoflavitalea sp. G-6-1-2 TaxID=2728841 RepID=UPI00146F6D0F|nr:DUF6252 family protein [Pseudoflavitalea sp. G-6-1-2]NML19750.1 hypothetical protein [Pseudoflavitalea sp. G-6-1-2]